MAEAEKLPSLLKACPPSVWRVEDPPPVWRALLAKSLFALEHLRLTLCNASDG